MVDVQVLRVFTRAGEGGNRLGVVAEAAGLGTARMQEIAAELGFSETIFLYRGAEDDRVRIFTPATELPFAGHPLVGAAWILGAATDGAGGVLTCGIGRLRYGIDGGIPWLEVPHPPTARPLALGAEVARTARLPFPHRSWMVSLPLRYLVLEVSDVAATPDFQALARDDLDAVYVVAQVGDRVRARFFAPSLGVDEDPATGSAAVALAAVRTAQGTHTGELIIHQGEEVGSPSQIFLRWSPRVVAIGGAVDVDARRRLPD